MVTKVKNTVEIKNHQPFFRRPFSQKSAYVQWKDRNIGQAIGAMTYGQLIGEVLGVISLGKLISNFISPDDDSGIFGKYIFPIFGTILGGVTASSSSLGSKDIFGSDLLKSGIQKVVNKTSKSADVNMFKIDNVKKITHFLRQMLIPAEGLIQKFSKSHTRGTSKEEISKLVKERKDAYKELFTEGNIFYIRLPNFVSALNETLKNIGVEVEIRPSSDLTKVNLIMFTKESFVHSSKEGKAFKPCVVAISSPEDFVDIMLELEDRMKKLTLSSEREASEDGNLSPLNKDVFSIFGDSLIKFTNIVPAYAELEVVEAKNEEGQIENIYNFKNWRTVDENILSLLPKEVEATVIAWISQVSPSNISTSARKHKNQTSQEAETVDDIKTEAEITELKQLKTALNEIGIPSSEEGPAFSKASKKEIDTLRCLMVRYYTDNKCFVEGEDSLSEISGKRKLSFEEYQNLFASLEKSVGEEGFKLYNDVLKSVLNDPDVDKLHILPPRFFTLENLIEIYKLKDENKEITIARIRQNLDSLIIAEDQEQSSFQRLMNELKVRT